MKKGKREVRRRISDRLRAAEIIGSKKRLPTEIQTLLSSSDEVPMYVFKNYTEVVNVYSFFLCLVETRTYNGRGIREASETVQ